MKGKLWGTGSDWEDSLHERELLGTGSGKGEWVGTRGARLAVDMGRVCVLSGPPARRSQGLRQNTVMHSVHTAEEEPEREA